MIVSRTNLLLKSTWLAILLATSLLVTQWVGVIHRTVHTQFLAQANFSYVAQDPTFLNLGDSSVPHSCVLFDALNWADVVASIIVIIPVIDPQYEVARQLVFKSRSVPFVRHCLSHGPPFSKF
jgi:hypothetical protein